MLNNICILEINFFGNKAEPLTYECSNRDFCLFLNIAFMVHE